MVNGKLGAATGWQLVAVPGLVPDLVFFDHLANRRFPVTRAGSARSSEFDYIVEPDIFHDFFGHVPMLFTPVFARLHAGLRPRWAQGREARAP